MVNELHFLLNGEYVLLKGYAEAGKNPNVEGGPTALFAFKTGYVLQYMVETKHSDGLEHFQGNYDLKEITPLLACAYSYRAFAFSYCEEDDSFTYPELANQDDMEALSEFCRGLRKEKLVKSKSFDYYTLGAEYLLWSHLYVDDSGVEHLVEIEFCAACVLDALNKTCCREDFFKEIKSNPEHMGGMREICSTDSGFGLEVFGTTSCANYDNESDECYDGIIRYFRKK